MVLLHVVHHLAEGGGNVHAPVVRTGDRGRIRAHPEARPGDPGDVLAEALGLLRGLAGPGETVATAAEARIVTTARALLFMGSL